MVDRYDEELFLEYVEGELPVEKRVAFENQMLQDPRLRNLVAQMVIDRHRMRTLPDEAPPTHMMDAVNERLERAMLLGSSPQEFNTPKKTVSNGFRWRRMATMGAMAAMIAMVAGVFIVTFVQLANDTPIRNVGPGSLFPPGILPPALGPRNPGTADGAGNPGDSNNANQAASNPNSSSTAGTDTQDPNQSPSLAMRPTDLFPDHSAHDAGSTPNNQTSSQATAAELAAAKAAAAGTGEPETTQANSTSEQTPAEVVPLGPLPDAEVLFNVTTTDLPAAHKRLTLWASAYQARVLDTRDITAPPQAEPQVDAAENAALGNDTTSAAETNAQPLSEAIATTAGELGDLPLATEKNAAPADADVSTSSQSGANEVKPIANQPIAIESEDGDAAADPTHTTGTADTTGTAGSSDAASHAAVNAAASETTAADQDEAAAVATATVDPAAPPAPAVLGVSVTLEITPDLLLPLETFLATLPGVEVERSDIAQPTQPESFLPPSAHTTGLKVPMYLLEPKQPVDTTSFAAETSLFDSLLPIWFTDPTTLWPQATHVNQKPTTAVVRVQIIAKP